MGTAISSRCTAVVFATVITASIPFSSAVAQGAQGLEGCLASGVAFPADYYLPDLWSGWVVVSDERRNAEQLAATFADPADALSRLHEWCWMEQAERGYVKDDLTVDVSVHDFSGTEGATLAQRWLGYQRANDLGLHGETKTSAQLEEELGRINIEALDNRVIDAFYKDTEYTLYARRDDLVGVSHSSDQKFAQDVFAKLRRRNRTSTRARSAPM